jgi:hypothetical protein
VLAIKVSLAPKPNHSQDNQKHKMYLSRQNRNVLDARYLNGREVGF